MFGKETVIYRTEDELVELKVQVERDTAWLTQLQMAELFDRNISTINEHIRNVFKEKELSGKSVIRKFRITAIDRSFGC